ncbi:MAG: class I SAM-dependent methyltransferase [Candidatus Bathyarchaeia archaeon]
MEELYLKLNLREGASADSKCSKYRTTWNMHCCINERKGSKQKRKKGELSVFHKFWTFDKNPVFDLLFNERLRRLIKIIDFDSNEYRVGLEIGCGGGYFSRYLAHQINGTVVGVDLSKAALYYGKFLTEWGALGHTEAEFVLADANHLPFGTNSFDLVVCASVFEHIKELRGALKEIENSMRNNGNLVAGYPIEMKLFLVLVKLFTPQHMKIRNPKILGEENFDRNPDTHKQSFMTIRSLLQQQFILTHREKFFFTILPDAISWYECVKMKKRN